MPTEGPYPPEGFLPLRRSSPFLGLLGQIYEKIGEDGIVLGMRVEPQHANNRSLAHGGLLFTLADLVLGMNISRAAGQGHGLTVSMSLDFISAARAGEWVTATAEVQHAGKTLGFASCRLSAGTRQLVRASAVFRMESLKS